MIQLKVADYCHHCDQFSPGTNTEVFFCNGAIYNRETTVFCKDQERCKGIYDAIIKTIGKPQEVQNEMPVRK